MKPEEEPLLQAEHQRSDAADPDSANGHAKTTERALVEVLSSLSHVWRPSATLDTPCDVRHPACLAAARPPRSVLACLLACQRQLPWHAMNCSMATPFTLSEDCCQAQRPEVMRALGVPRLARRRARCCPQRRTRPM